MLNLKKGIVIATLLMTFNANAEWMYTDWLEEGDQAATLDIETGIEWLKLYNTNTMTFEAVEAEMETGGLFEGWRFPTVNEVKEWSLSLIKTQDVIDNIDTLQYSRSLSYNSDWAFDWRDANGRPYSQGNDRVQSFGLFRDDNGTIFLNGVVRRFTNQTQEVYLNLDWTDTDYAENQPGAGIFLVSDGGDTLSSQNNPSLNINNPDAPINEVPITFIGLLAFAGLLVTRRK